jgi:hypothetical protein
LVTRLVASHFNVNHPSLCCWSRFLAWKYLYKAGDAHSQFIISE